jgi:hypothetical protein
MFGDGVKREVRNCGSPFDAEEENCRNTSFLRGCKLSGWGRPEAEKLGSGICTDPTGQIATTET